MSYHNSIRYEQLVDECGLVELEDGLLIEAEYIPLIRRLKALMRFASAQCNLQKLLALKKQHELERLIARVRKQIAKACLYEGHSKDNDLIQAGVALEEVVIQARKGRKKERMTISSLHAQLTAA